MKLLLDECVPQSALDALRGAGFDADSILSHLLPNSEDKLVAATADALRAVIVSHDRDFKQIISRRPDGQVKQYKNASLIKMDCHQWRIADRLLSAMPAIKFEFDLRHTMKDKRTIVWVSADFIRIWR